MQRPALERLEEIKLRDGRLIVVEAAPGVKITVGSVQPLFYGTPWPCFQPARQKHLGSGHA